MNTRNEIGQIDANAENPSNHTANQRVSRREVFRVVVMIEYTYVSLL